MATALNAFHCPHCGHFISGQEPSSRQLFSYIEQLESFAHLPINLQEMLREKQRLWKELRPVAILVAKMDHYVSLIEQHTVDVSNNLRLEIHARLLNRVLGAIIPTIDQRDGSILELRPESILVVWGMLASENDRTKAISTALEIQGILLRIEEEHINSQDLALKIGVTGGRVYAGTIGTAIHQSYTVIGPAVVEAARLSDIAEPGQTLVDHIIYESTKDAIIYERPTTQGELTKSGIRPQYYVALEEKAAPV